MQFFSIEVCYLHHLAPRGLVDQRHSLYQPCISEVVQSSLAFCPKSSVCISCSSGSFWSRPNMTALFFTVRSLNSVLFSSLNLILRYLLNKIAENYLKGFKKTSLASCLTSSRRTKVDVLHFVDHTRSFSRLGRWRQLVSCSGISPQAKGVNLSGQVQPCPTGSRGYGTWLEWNQNLHLKSHFRENKGLWIKSC